jgi:hypothetical protein
VGTIGCTDAVLVTRNPAIIIVLRRQRLTLGQIERLERYCVAYQYSKAHEEVSRSEEEMKGMEDERDRCALTDPLRSTTLIRSLRRRPTIWLYLCGV